MSEKCTYSQAGLQTETCPECGRRHEPVAVVRADPMHYVAAMLILAVAALLLMVASNDPIALVVYLIFVGPFGLAALICLGLLVAKPRWGVPMTRVTVIVTLTCVVIVTLFFLAGLWIW